MAINDIVLVSIIGVFALSGLISGFVKSMGKLFALAGAGLLSFYLGGVVSGLLISNIQAVSEWVAANEGWGGSVVLVGSYVGVFLIGFIILKIIVSQIRKLVNAGKIGKFLDKSIGLIVGAAFGLVICDIYVWVLYGLSMGVPEVSAWVIGDAQLEADGFVTFTKAIMELNLQAIGVEISEFPGLGGAVVPPVGPETGGEGGGAETLPPVATAITYVKTLIAANF